MENNTKRNFFFFYNRYIGNNLIFYIETLLSLFINNIIALIIPFLTKTLVDDALIGKDFILLVILLLIIGIVQIISEIGNTIGRYIYTFLIEQINFRIKTDVFKHILKLPMQFFDNKRTGEIFERINDSQAINDLMNTVFLNLFDNIFKIVVNIGACFFINPIATLVLLAYLPIFVVYYLITGKIAKKQEFERWENTKLLSSEKNEALVGIRTIKAFSVEGKVFRKIKWLSIKFREMVLRYERRFIVLRWFYSLFSSLENFFLFLTNGFFIINGSMTIGEWMAFQTISSQVFNPLRSLLDINRNFQKSFLSIERLYEIYHLEEEKQTSNTNIIIKEGNIRFSNVIFNYSNDRKTLNNINLDIKKGETIALVGRSGVGKTTISNLIAKFYLPTSGQIFIDDIDIAEYDVRTLRNGIGIVLQDIYLFYGSIMDNLLLSSASRNEKDAIDACKKAHAHEFISSLPDGYNTKIGEKGVKLSGGQKQRISIAQAILKNPKILILDEATSHLDLETEEIVQDALNQLMKDRTSIIIAHRLSTIQKASYICVVENGEIIETGSHKDLIERDTFYRKLFTKTANL